MEMMHSPAFRPTVVMPDLPLRRAVDDKDQPPVPRGVVMRSLISALQQRYKNQVAAMKSEQRSELREKQRDQALRRALKDLGGRILGPDVGARLDKLAAAVRGAASRGDDAAVLHDVARQLFEDPSDLSLALSILARDASAQGAPDSAQQLLLGRAQALVEKQHGKRFVEAGIRASAPALAATRSGMGPDGLRALYREYVCSEVGTVPLYGEICKQYGTSLRLPVLDFLETACCADRDAMDPSGAHAEFGFLTHCLVELRALRSADMACNNALLRDLGPCMRQPAVQACVVEVMVKTLQGDAAAVVETVARLVPMALGGADRTQQVVAVNHVLSALRQMPAELFAGESREPVLTALTELAGAVRLAMTSELHHA
jgi:type III secretion system YopN/LcrE/InvE/MxiC family regulator